MREIKFRAYLKTQRKMVYFDLWDHDCTHLDQDCDFDEKTDVVMQYTGLKDRNGRDIYEEDVIEYELQQIPIRKTEAYEVIWRQSGFGFKRPGEEDGCATYLQLSKVAVIGNIYENPELCPTSS